VVVSTRTCSRADDGQLPVLAARPGCSYKAETASLNTAVQAQLAVPWEAFASNEVRPRQRPAWLLSRARLTTIGALVGAQRIARATWSLLFHATDEAQLKEVNSVGMDIFGAPCNDRCWGQHLWFDFFHTAQVAVQVGPCVLLLGFWPASRNLTPV
jgi:hypothetical protein